MGLFLGTLAFLIVFLRLFYLFNRTTEACGGLDSLLIVDFGVTGTSLPGVLLYRLCFRSLLGVERIEEDGFGIKGKELYGTMDKEEEEQQNLEE